MAKPATRSSTQSSETPRARRLTAEARRKSILQAARRAFTETGDMNGTTIRHIAERGGISEGVIYRHFESKDQLFFEAVVEPLTEAVDKLVAAAEVVDRDEPLTPERQVETINGLYRQLIHTLEEILPLLGLVLFGDPKVARRFYRRELRGRHGPPRRGLARGRGPLRVRVRVARHLGAGDHGHRAGPGPRGPPQQPLRS